MSTEQANPQDNDSGKQLRVVHPVPLMAKRSLVTRTIDRVVPRKSKFLGFSWILAVLGVMVLLGNIQGEASQFYGIAESQLRSISFQYPVEIVEIPVVEGQRVDDNSRLLEVKRYDLDVSRSVLDEQITETRARIAATRHLVSSEITSLKAQRSSQIEALNTRINSLETRHQLNQALLDSISANTSSGSSRQSPLQVKIRGLKAEKKQIGQFFQARIDLQKQKLADISGPGDARIAELVKQKNELLRQSAALVVRAPFAGSVGSVMFKPGEQVEAFNPVMSIQGLATRHIKGYIHEAVSNNIRIGQSVWIESMNAVGEERLIEGRVESLGSRIIEYPARLKRNPLVSAWGREAIISVTPDNDILQGEKVSVWLQRPESALSIVASVLARYLPVETVHAWYRFNGDAMPATPRDIEVQIENMQARQIEASGIAWNPASGSYLLVSDEQSALFELSTAGRITRQFSLDSIGKITDLESISRDGSTFYLAASLSHNRDRVLKSKRRKLMRLRLDEGVVNAGESIDLYQVLQGLLQHDGIDAALREFIRGGIEDHSFDLEAHAVLGNNLYLGFKSPLDARGNTVILELRDVGALFDAKPVMASLWMTLDLRARDGGASRLSAFTIDESGLYLLTVAADNDQVSSQLWQFDIASGRLTRKSGFAGLKAEGISIEGGVAEAVIVFDGGGNAPSQIVRSQL